MADIKEHSFNKRYPLSFVREDFKGVRDFNIKGYRKEFHFETPMIHFNSYLDGQTIRYYFKKHLPKYLPNIIKQVDEYIDINFPYTYGIVANHDIVVTYGIYFQRFNEGTEEGPEKQVLSFQDGDRLPTYSFRGISSNFFPTSFKILAKAYVYILSK